MENSVRLTKEMMVDFLVKEISDCGFNDYYGYKISDEDFKKKLMRQTKGEISSFLNDYSDATQKFLQTDSRYI